MAAVRDDQVAGRHRLRVGEPRHQHRVARDARSRRLRLAAVVGRDHPHALVREPRQRGAQQPVLAGPAPSRARRARPGRRRAAASTRSPGGSHSSGPTTRSHAGQSRGYSSCGSVATSVSERESPVWTHGSGPSPSRARQSLYSRRPCSRPRATSRSVCAPQRPPGAGARQPRADRVRREARRQVRMHVRDERRHRHALELGGQRGGGREDVRHRDVRRRTSAPPAASRAPPAPRPRTASAAARGVGNTWYSGAAANVIPAASAGSCQRRQVCSATSCPRATSASPRASIGNACPGSPKAPSRTLKPPSSATSRSCCEAVVERPRHRGDHQRADAGVAVHREPLAHAVGRPAQRDRVDQLLGQRRGGLVALALEVEVLHLAGRRPRTRSGARARCRSSCRATPCRRRTAPRTGRIASRARRRVVGDHHVHGRGDVEVVEALAVARAREALLQQRPELGDVLGGEEGRDPAVGDLGRQRRCSSARSRRGRSGCAPAPARS